MNIPQSYKEWLHCITVVGQQKLNLSYIEAQIKNLNSLDNEMTKQFIELYGDQQRIKTIAWFEQSKSALK